MLRTSYPSLMTEQDHHIFDALVPADHYLRQVQTVVDFERYRSVMAACYSATDGRPADDPVLLLKLSFLQVQYNLSDRDVLIQTQVNVAFRFFLNFALTDPLPHPSLLTVFRARLGAAVYQQIFDGVVTQARAHGLVKDRLRLKDATHVIANIAVSATIRLVAATRQRLLDAAHPFAAEQVVAERAHALALRAATTDLTDAERLLQRVTHLRQIVAWGDQVAADLGPLPPAPSPERRVFADALALAHKILADRDDPGGGDQVVSVHDPDARRGKHGSFFTGYLLDVLMDAESQIITALDVLPANDDEAADATKLIAHEETAHDNDVQTLSIDKVGFRGELLREWQQPDGLAMEVVVPPIPEKPTSLFTAADFVHDADQATRTRPAQVTTTRRTRNHVGTGWKYIFPRPTCLVCPLQPRCAANLPTTTGRMVMVNDYAAEYTAARQKATTAAYHRVRRKHPAIERKLADIVRNHGVRRTRYWSRNRTRMQYLLTGLAVNVKRMVRLLLGPPQAQGQCVAAYPIAG